MLLAAQLVWRVRVSCFCWTSWLTPENLICCWGLYLLQLMCPGLLQLEQVHAVLDQKTRPHGPRQHPQMSHCHLQRQAAALLLWEK